MLFIHGRLTMLSFWGRIHKVVFFVLIFLPAKLAFAQAKPEKINSLSAGFPGQSNINHKHSNYRTAGPVGKCTFFLAV